MDREPQLIAKLFRKIAGGETTDNAVHKLLTLLRVQFAMLQTAAHQGPRPTVPKPFRVREDELNGLFYGVRYRRAWLKTGRKISEVQPV
jgi:hypothetical protein